MWLLYKGPRQRQNETETVSSLARNRNETGPSLGQKQNETVSFLLLLFMATDREHRERPSTSFSGFSRLRNEN